MIQSNIEDFSLQGGSLICNLKTGTLPFYFMYVCNVMKRLSIELYILFLAHYPRYLTSKFQDTYRRYLLPTFTGIFIHQYIMVHRYIVLDSCESRVHHQLPKAIFIMLVMEQVFIIFLKTIVTLVRVFVVCERIKYWCDVARKDDWKEGGFMQLVRVTAPDKSVNHPIFPLAPCRLGFYYTSVHWIIILL